MLISPHVFHTSPGFMAAAESRTLRRIRVLPRQQKPSGREQTPFEPPYRKPEQQLSIILPLPNNAGNPLPTLLTTQSARAAGHEVVVVHDRLPRKIIELIEGLVDQTVEGACSLAGQMNLGVRHAWGEQLLFLHVGCLLPEQADQQILGALAEGSSQWGCFSVRFSGNRLYSWFAGLPVNWRSRLRGVAIREQGLFLRRSLFERVGGFPGESPRETEAISKVLKRSGPPLVLQTIMEIAPGGTAVTRF